MFLRSLELNGFKSFASKTVLEFPVGITGIVGPNGSGKSNIIDCIRWLLGERDSKNLRGSKIEDLIWSGTPRRARVSVAQAGLHFDNNSGFFPVDFREVSVSRRVSRDGASQYFLNKSEVRLKDIVDFFSRSRLGVKGLTVVGQGSSDLFVRVSSEERRVMVEEILGLREYQLKKSEAERKLKNTFFNLEKAEAMIQEVLPRLRLLKRQTNKWAKRREIEDELNNLEHRYFSFKLGEIGAVEAELKPKLVLLEGEITHKQEELTGLESQIKKVESSADEYEKVREFKKEQSQLSKERSEIQKELGRLEAKIEFLSAAGTEDKTFKNEELVIFIGDIKKSLENGLRDMDLLHLKNIIQDLVQKITAFLKPAREKGFKSKELDELEEMRKRLILRFESLEKGIKGLEEKEMKITQALEESNKQFQKNFELIETKREEVGKLREQKNKLIFEKERCNLKMQEIESRLSEIGKSVQDFDARSATTLAEAELHNTEKRMFRLRTELASIGEIDEALIREAKEVEDHYVFLKNQSDDLKKAAQDLKILIKDLGEKIRDEFNTSLKKINEEFNKFFRLMFGGGQAKLKIKKQELRISISENEEGGANDADKRVKGEINRVEEEERKEAAVGIEIDLSLPKKRITGLDMLSGGEKSLVSIAALFSLISVSPPPFLVLDEIDAALDEKNSKRFSDLIREFSKKTQFIVVTHNRTTMEAADLLYGVTMSDDGTSKVLSLKLEV